MRFISAALVLVFVSAAVAQAPSPQLIIKDWCDWPLRLEFSPNGRELARVCFGYAVAFYDTGNYYIARTFLSELEHTPELKAFAFSPDGTMIATVFSSEAQVWSAANAGKPWTALNSDRRPAVRGALSPTSVEEKSAWVLGEVYTWDTPLRILDGRASSIKFSPNGKLLLTVDKTQARVWNTTSWKIEREIPDPNQGLEDAFFSPDGKLLLTCFANGNFKVWNVSSWTVQGEFVVNNDGPGVITFAPDSQTVMISGNDGVIHQWSLPRKTEIRTLHTFEGPRDKSMLIGLAFSPDGRTLVATSFMAAKPVIVWNTRGWSAQTESGYNSAAFSNDGKLLALGGRNHIKLLESASLKQLRDIDLPQMARGDVTTHDENESNPSGKIPCDVSALAFSPDNNTLAAGCFSHNTKGTVRVIKMD